MEIIRLDNLREVIISENSVKYIRKNSPTEILVDEFLLADIRRIRFASRRIDWTASFLGTVLTGIITLGYGGGMLSGDADLITLIFKDKSRRTISARDFDSNKLRALRKKLNDALKKYKERKGLNTNL